MYSRYNTLLANFHSTSDSSWNQFKPNTCKSVVLFMIILYSVAFFGRTYCFYDVLLLIKCLICCCFHTILKKQYITAMKRCEYIDYNRGPYRNSLIWPGHHSDQHVDEYCNHDHVVESVQKVSEVLRHVVFILIQGDYIRLSTTKYRPKHGSKRSHCAGNKNRKRQTDLHTLLLRIKGCYSMFYRIV